jgi:anti-anti-sigma factor
VDSMGLLFNAHRCGRCLVVNVGGNVGAATAEPLTARLRDALDSVLLLIAVNLADAVLADASALEVLTAIHRRAVQVGKVFLVVAPDPEAYETMRATGLDRSLLVFPTVADFAGWNRGPSAIPADEGTLACGWCTPAGFRASRLPGEVAALFESGPRRLGPVAVDFKRLRYVLLPV